MENLFTIVSKILDYHCLYNGYRYKVKNRSELKRILIVEASQPVKIFQTGSKKTSVMSQPLFWVATFVYGAILAIGFFNPIAGLAGLAVIALLSIIKILFKNFALIAGMILLGVICTVIPFLLIVYIPLLIIFFVMRLGYFLEHWQVVLAGLFIYFLPAYLLSVGGGVFVVIPMVLLPIIINYFYRKHDYTVGKILELLSEAPVLIISIILPFLKLGAIIGDAPIASTVGNSPIDSHGVAPDAIAAKPISVPHMSYSSNSDIVSDINHLPIDSATPVVTYNHFNPNFNPDSFFNKLSNSHQLFNQSGHENISSFGGSIKIGFGYQQIELVKDGFHLNILDSNAHQIGTIESSMLKNGLLDVKDTHGIKIGEVQLAQDDSSIIFKDTHNMVIATVDNPIQGSGSLDADFIQATIGKTQLVLDNLAVEQHEIEVYPPTQSEIPVLSSWEVVQGKISLALLNVLAINKEKSIKTDGSRVIDVRPLESQLDIGSKSENISESLIEDDKYKSNFKPYRPITFAKYIEQHCSNNFKKHEKIFLTDRFYKLDAPEWSTIKETYGVDKEDIGFIASTALLFKGSNGFIITKDDVIHAREIGGEPISYHVTQIAGIKKGGFSDANHLDNDNLFVVSFNGISGIKPIFKELNELFVQYRQS